MYYNKSICTKRTTFSGLITAFVDIKKLISLSFENMDNEFIICPSRTCDFFLHYCFMFRNYKPVICNAIQNSEYRV